MGNTFLNNKLEQKLIVHGEFKCMTDPMDNMMDGQSEIDDNSSDFLPDLTEGKTIEQIAFEEKV